LAELRWILLGLGTLAIGAIWWWSARRSAQAPGNAQLRESTVGPVATPAPLQASMPAPASAEMPHVEKRSIAGAEGRASAEWSISPLEPLSIRTADFEDVPVMDQPMMTHPDPLDVTQDLGSVHTARTTPGPRSAAPAASAPKSAVPAAGAAKDAVLAAPGLRSAAREAPAMQPGGAAHIPTLAAPPGPSPPRPVPEHSDRLDAVAPANSSEKQKIVTVRVCAVGETRWPGARLMSTLEEHGLAYGRYQVYHRKHADGRSVFCVASLIEPGTFDVARMPSDQFRGVSLFAVLPGPLEPLQTVDALFATARDLARDLSGTVQDAKGIPFSPQRVAALREDVARFQAELR
jgi:cell division protein ZipA